MKTITIGRIGKWKLAFAFVHLAGGAFAALTDVRTWTDATDNHIWGDANNWDPKVAVCARNVFPPGKDWEVRITQNDHFYFSIELPEGEGTVTFTDANGLLMPNGDGGFIQIGAGRELRVDGPKLSLARTITCGRYLDTYDAFINGTLRLVSGAIEPMPAGATGVEAVFGDAAKLIVEGGTFGADASILCLTNNATMVISGGLAKLREWRLRSPDPPCESITRLRLLGGTLHQGYQYTYTFVVRDGAHFDFRGGTLLWGSDENFLYNCLSSTARGSQGQGAAFPEFLPKPGAELVIPSGSTNNWGAVYFYVAGDYDVGGTIYATNNTEVTAGNIVFEGTNVALRGGATIYANAVCVKSPLQGNRVYDLDLKRLNLGIGGLRRQTGAGTVQTINLRDGIEFGAWGGNVLSGASANMTVYLEGPVLYDTQDVFDPGTSRDIYMNRLGIDAVSDLKATGGGTVTLSTIAKRVEELRTIEVAADTALAFPSNNYATGLKTMNLKLGENARLMVSLAAGAGGYVDASATAEFGAGAKIVVTELPASLVEGKLYPIYFAPAGTDPDLSAIEYAHGAWPAGWAPAKTGNAVYLADGKATSYSGPKAKTDRIWSDAGADNDYFNAANWVSNEVAGTTSTYATFKGAKGLTVDVTRDLSVLLFDLSDLDLGPLCVGGESIRFYYPVSEKGLAMNAVPSVRHSGKFPAVISNNVNGDGFLRQLSYAEGSVALTGGGGAALGGGWCPLGFGGDIRLGGNWTSDYVRVVAAYDNSKGTVKWVTRNSRLTVMPGGSLTVLNQTGDVNENCRGAFAVAATAAATISGADLTFTSNNTHYVDGALTVNCPLVPTARQVFRGDGTLTLAGGVADAPAGGVRVEGNMTLVPANWFGSAPLSVKENVTIAPTGDWTFRGSSFELAHHSALTLATGAHTLTLGCPLVSPSSTLTVTGGGTVALGAAGSVLGKVTLADGAKLTLAKAISNGQYADVLAVREDDASIAFEEGCKVSKFVDEETGYTVYSVKKLRSGLLLVIR